ncbi:sensor histidine kinase [Ruficoccus amylovorans]|uniref:histidine kinase n=1 Tax=Ruficoccus amylovorans TaxID=1804625 RepID=A0A842HD19_9BACT|nr:sensor histidine kinase [Ruficoccus amylovorans]
MNRIARYRLVWIVCLMLLAGFLANSISSFYVSRANVRETITESSLPLTSDNIYSVIQRDLLRPIFISSMMANDAFLRDWTLAGENNVGQMQRYLEEIRREYGTVASFFVSEKSRNYYYWGGVLKQVAEDEPRDVWYYRVREMEQPFEINVDIDMANHDALTVFVNYRVYDYDNNFIGSAGTGLTVNRVNALIKDYEARFNREIFFVSGEGEIVLRPAASDLSSYGNLSEIPGLSGRASELLQTREETRMSYERDGKTFFVNSRWVPELNWYLMVEQSEDELLSPLRKNLLLNVLLAVVITALVSWMCLSAVSLHQKRLRARNEELSTKNREIEHQKRELQRTANELEEANVALSALNREKDEFLGIVAHDLRSPLGSILGLCVLLEDDLAKAPGRSLEFLKDIEKCSLHMQELIGDILDISSIESFHGPVELEPCVWNRLAEEVRDRFRVQAAAKDIDLVTRLDPAAEQEVLTRGKWLAICLNNLVSNAIKYSPRGSQVRIETAVLPDGACELRVRDEGMGIAEEEREQLFQKFSPLSSRPTGGEQSSGLGLYIVRKMCQRLGATVELLPDTTQGCCFVIRHPRYSTRRV